MYIYIIYAAWEVISILKYSEDFNYSYKVNLKQTRF